MLNTETTARCSKRWTLLAAVVLAGILAGTALASDLTTEVLEDTGDRIVLRYTMDGFDQTALSIDAATYTAIALDRESPDKTVVGAPQLPRVSRSLWIPDDAQMAVEILEASYYEISDMDVSPSKGILLRTTEPAGVPYTFGPEYGVDAFYPGELASLRDPYILRDVRGAVVDLNPFQYNPVTRVLRVYDDITIEVYADAPGGINVRQDVGRAESRAFYSVYRSHFINFDHGDRYDPIDESGEMLVIAHDAWTANMQPFVTHKNSIGINTTMVTVSSVGNNTSDIEDYIQDVYDNRDLAFVLLVGDGSQVATPQSAGGASDPSYSKVDGNDDYPDIIIGRFSAESADDVDTQVQRSIEYETGPSTAEAWFWKGVGVASDQGPGDDNEYDDEHLDTIRGDLLGSNYTDVDQIYDPGANASQVSTALNDGRGIINYTGHGSMTSWSSSGFSNNDINALTNDNMLPFIVSVACVNGQFDAGTCFAEAWLRATHNGNPTGAVATYMSSINQSWDPPMAAQDEFVDLMVAEDYITFGALCFAGSSLMIDEYGNDGVSMFDTWHIFGDPSLTVVGEPAPPSGLLVDPGDGLEAEGGMGGPFTPDSIVYTLENIGDSALDFTVSSNVSWLDIGTLSGSLSAFGNTTVTVTIDEGTAAGLPEGVFDGLVEFTNNTDHVGDTTRTATLQIGEPALQYEWPLDTDPGWDMTGEWAYGVPQGGGGEHGSTDPTSGATGDHVYGYNLDGDYVNNLSEKHLTTAPIDCSGLTGVTLRFQRWLGVETSEYDHAYVRVSTDGSSWTTVWENEADETADSSWEEQEIDISAIADGQAAVQIRWTMGDTDQGWVYCGWNIDDIEIWSYGMANCWDNDGDGHLDQTCGGTDCDDEDSGIYPGAEEICDDGEDNDCDGDVDGDDGDCGGDDDDDDTGDDDDTELPGDDDEGDDDDGRIDIGGTGCECHGGGASSTNPAWLTLGLVALLAVRRRFLL